MKITIIQGDEWWGIYKDGQLVIEENPNSIDAKSVLEALDIPFETKYPDEDWLYENNSLPEQEDDVVLNPEP